MTRKKVYKFYLEVKPGERFEIETIDNPSCEIQARELYEEINHLYLDREIDPIDTILLYQEAARVTGRNPGDFINSSSPFFPEERN